MLGGYIRLARQRRRMSIEELAERVGVTHTTIRKIEHGDLGVGIGLAFEAASVLGINLFEEDAHRLHRELGHVQTQLALLPRRVSQLKVADNF